MIKSPVALETLKGYYDLCLTQFSKIHRKMKILDSVDSGDLWNAICAKLPSYQILPDTNYISYIKNNLLASVYSVEKSAEIQPTSEEDKEIVINLNMIMNHIWSKNNVGFYQFQAGERAALLNIGVTQVGWDDTVIAGSNDNFIKGNIALKNIDPLKFMYDPFAPDFYTAGYCMTYDTYHKSVFEESSIYKEGFQQYIEKYGSAAEDLPRYNAEISKAGQKDYYTLTIFWVKQNNKVHEIHVLGNKEIVYVKEDIRPSCFPFAVLYCNLPGTKLIGTSECSKILANNIAINIMNSLALTAEYKNQRPPKFINDTAGLNLDAFIKHGNDADYTFVVNGKAIDAVHYHEYPKVSPEVNTIAMSLEKGIEQMTGVDARYAGKDTGSIITTGGVEKMLDRATLIDIVKITTYEHYCKELTKLILGNFIEFAPKRNFFIRDKVKNIWINKTIDFPKIPSDTLFDYRISISSELPNNKQRIAQMANMLMEKQMQYGDGGGVELITVEEWLMFQDIPNKEMFLERMGIQRLQNATEDVTQTLFSYKELIQQGMDPGEAIAAVAKIMEDKRKGIGPEEGPIPAVLQGDGIPVGSGEQVLGGSPGIPGVSAPFNMPGNPMPFGPPGQQFNQ